MAIQGDPDNLGTDVALVSDLAPVWGLASGRVNLAYALLRRFTTPRGGLFYDPDYGYDLTALVNAALGQADISAARGATVAEAQKEQRVQSAAVTFDFNFARRELRILIRIEDADGPFDLILRATDVTVALLAVDGVQQAAAAATADAGTATTSGPGSPGPQGIQGIQGPPGTGASSPEIVLGDARIMASNLGTEEVVFQWDGADFGALAVGTLTGELACSALSASGTATFRLRVGGTDGGVDGTTIATVTATSSGYLKKNGSGTFTNPTGLNFVKVTAQSSAGAVDARIKGPVVTFR